MFPLFSTGSYVVTIRWNRLNETIPTNGNNIGIDWEIRKLAFEKYSEKKKKKKVGHTAFIHPGITL